jgi:uncharacterized protein
MPTLARNPTLRLPLLATLLSLAGCFSLSHGAPPQQHYVLGAGGAPEEAVAPADRSVEEAGTQLVGLRPLRLADYLASPFIVIRRGSHQIEFSEYHRWGEDLGRAINQTVAGRLAAHASHHRIEVAPWPAGTPPDRVIQLHVLRFEGVAREGPGNDEAEAHLLATWEILRPLDGAVLARGSTEVREGGLSVGDFDGLVSLLDATLDVLARDLALGLERDPPP